jgi:allene oxide cyclase-like protein
MRTSIGIGVAAAGALAAGLAGGGLAGAQEGAQVIRLTSVEQHCATADNGKRGESLGDLLACRGALRNAEGGRAGRTHWTCVFLGRERLGEDCSAIVNLRGGTLQAAGLLSHTSPASEWAITGGTGSYAGARGTVALRQVSPTRTAAVVTLLP